MVLDVRVGGGLVEVTEEWIGWCWTLGLGRWKIQ